MIKNYIVEELDCAHCAAKIEEAVGKLPGVSKSTLTFLTQKLVVEVDDAHASTLTASIKKIMKDVEPDAELVEK